MDLRRSASRPASTAASPAAAPAALEWAAARTAAASAASVCRLRLLGDFAIEIGPGEFAASAWRRSHARRLLQLLGSAARLAQPRERVLQALWPDFDEARARNRLHHTIHWVRQALDGMPVAARLQIVVCAEKIELALPPGAQIDAHDFERLLDGDEPDAAQRLYALEQALALYRGDLAPDWVGCAEIDARRGWLAQRRDKAVKEAIELARELRQFAVALRYAHERAMHLHDDGAAHCEYALLLHEARRPDAALFHCKSVRAQVAAADPAAAAQIDETMRLIQQQANQAAPPSQATATEAWPDANAAVDAPRGLVSRLCVPAPRQALRGGEAWLAAGVQQLDDPYTSVLTVVGPPGAGKSLLAAWVAHQAQGRFRHGCVSVDAAALQTQSPESLQLELVRALEPLCGSPFRSESGLATMLSGKEMLVWIDGIHPGPALARTVARLAGLNADVRWLLTAWAPLRVVGERTLRVEPQRLLEGGSAASPTPAARILAEHLALDRAPQDRRAWMAIERVAGAVDGLPRALQLVAAQLAWLSPSELLARLDRDPAAWLREGDQGRCETDFAGSLRHWLAAAPVSMRAALGVLGRCQSWLCRRDLATLVGDGDEAALDALLEHGVTHHYLLRRVRERSSEFRVPGVVGAALCLAGDGAAQAPANARIERWIAAGPAGFGESRASGFDAGAGWFDDRADDVDAVVRRWQAAGCTEQLQAFGVQHAARWALTRWPQRALAWLDLALQVEHPELPPLTAAQLLLERARLHGRTGDLRQACDDASLALARLGNAADSGLRREALALLLRHGTRPDPAQPQQAAQLLAKGIEAGEHLLRVAELALREGRLAQALSICNQCVEVYAHFGVTRGLARAHLYRARIAFTLGNTALARRCLQDAEGGTPLPAEAARIELLRADVDLHEQAYTPAMERAARVMAQAEHARVPALVARALQITAWCHYGQGALPLAGALCGVIREQAQQAGRAGLVVNADILAALIDARHGRVAPALQRLAAAVDLQGRSDPPSDIQNDLITAAELSAGLDRPDLAARMLSALDAFAAQPEHGLRPWVLARKTALDGCIEARTDGAAPQPAPTKVPLHLLPLPHPHSHSPAHSLAYSHSHSPRAAPVETLRYLVAS